MAYRLVRRSPSAGIQAGESRTQHSQFAVRPMRDLCEIMKGTSWFMMRRYPVGRHAFAVLPVDLDQLPSRKSPTWPSFMNEIFRTHAPPPVLDSLLLTSNILKESYISFFSPNCLPNEMGTAEQLINHFCHDDAIDLSICVTRAFLNNQVILLLLNLLLENCILSNITRNTHSVCVVIYRFTNRKTTVADKMQLR